MRNISDDRIYGSLGPKEGSQSEYLHIRVIKQHQWKFTVKKKKSRDDFD